MEKNGVNEYFSLSQALFHEMRPMSPSAQEWRVTLISGNWLSAPISVLSWLTNLIIRNGLPATVLSVSVAIDSYYEENFDRLVLLKASCPRVEMVLWDQPFQEASMPEEEVFILQWCPLAVRFSLAKDSNMVGLIQTEHRHLRPL